MFVIQRVLETEGKLTLLDQNRVIRPNPWFRLFATTNTIGLGDTTGLYHGTQAINQGQMDRWNIVTTLNYLPAAVEAQIVLAKSGEYDNPDGKADRREDDQGRRPVAAGLHQRRHLDRDEPAHGDQLGAERADLRRRRLRLPGHLPQQVRRGRAAADRRILPARVRQRTCPKAWPRRPTEAFGWPNPSTFSGAPWPGRHGRSPGTRRSRSFSRRRSRPRRARPRESRRPARRLQARLVAEAGGPPIRWRFACAITTTGSIPLSRRSTPTRAPCSTRWRRRGSRRWAPA